MAMKITFTIYAVAVMGGTVMASNYDVRRFDEFYPGNTNSNIGYPVIVNDKLVFQATTPKNGSELWVIDSATMHPKILKDLAPGSSSGMLGELTMQSFGDVAFFNTGHRTMMGLTNGKGLYRTDGTAAGTESVSTYLETAVGTWPTPKIGTEIGARLSTTEIILGLRNITDTSRNIYNKKFLYKMDGTTLTLLQNFSNADYFDLWNFYTFKGKVYFSASTPSAGEEVWSTDGTPSGTTMLKDINVGSGGSRCDKGNSQWGTSYSAITKYFDFLAVNADLMLFRRNDGTNGCELWKTDGTTAGTTQVKDINPGNASSYPSNFVHFDGKIFFQAYTPTYGFEMWYSDGTAEGTALLKDVDTRPGGNPFGGTMYAQWNTGPLGVVANSKLYYASYSNTSTSNNFDFVLIASNGTRAGTHVVNDSNPIRLDLYSGDYLINYHGELYFINTDKELYVLNQTNQLQKLHERVRVSNRFPIVYGNTLYFVADNVTSCSDCGDELYYVQTDPPAIEATTTTTTMVPTTTTTTVVAATTTTTTMAPTATTTGSTSTAAAITVGSGTTTKLSKRTLDKKAASLSFGVLVSPSNIGICITVFALILIA